MHKNFLMIIIVISLSILFTGCGEEKKTISYYEKKGTIIMGTNAQFSPFESYEDEKIVGFDIEIAQKIAQKIGVELVIEDMNFNTLIDALNQEKIDFILAGMTITDDRKEKVDFSNPYYSSGQVIMTMNTNSQINTKADLVNKRIGVQIGTTGAIEAAKIEGVKISEYNTALASIMDMKVNNLDAIIFDLEPCKNFALINPDIKIIEELLTKEDYAIGVRKYETELQTVINQVLDEMKNSGEYNELINKYFK